MSLFRKLMFSISALVLFLMAGNALVSVVNAKQYFVDQLTAVAQDTATSLGLSVSHAAADDDLAQIESMMDVIFDRGFYLSIHFKTLQGESLIVKQRNAHIYQVPTWFVRLISIPVAKGQSEVISGWRRIGIIEVEVHPGYAYQDLWRVFMQQTWLFLFAAVCAYLAAGFGVKHLLKPLINMERQAEAICRKELPDEIVLPSTPELRRVVVAMNRMVSKLQQVFQQQVELSEALRRERNMDKLTELPNREEFDVHLETWMSSEMGGSPSILVMIQVSCLAQVNLILGREVGDRLLIGVAEQLNKLTSSLSDAFPGRHAGGDLCIFIPGLVAADAISVLDQMREELMQLHVLQEVRERLGDEVVLLEYGVASARAPCKVSSMLSVADTSLREYDAITEQWSVFPVEEFLEDIRPASEWIRFLQEILEKQMLVLHYQVLVDVQASEKVLHNEVFARIQEGDKCINAGVFWPLVERFDFVKQLDRAVVKAAVDVLSDQKHACLSINLTVQSALDKDFQQWLIEQLQNINASSLSIELPEKALRQPLSELKTFIRGMASIGVGVAIDHFGVNPSALGVMQYLNLQYVKIDRRFTLNISQKPEVQFYIKSLCQIAVSCDVKVYADGVENKADWLALQQLGLDGGQGFYFAAPCAEIA